MRFDVAVVGAGAAGLHCAAIAGQLGLSVLLLDHSSKVAEKIRISGGGRCNFTNADVGPANFESANPDFCRSALARYRPADFIALLGAHRIPWHEKHKGQLFCDGSSAAVIDMLLAECAGGGVVRRQPCAVADVRRVDAGFELDTEAGPVVASQLVVATGGLSIPKTGASDWGHRLARRFDHRVVDPRPALVPFVCDGAGWRPFGGLAGVALPVRAHVAGGPKAGFDDDLLFTHRGLSGPAALQVSTFWRPGTTIEIDLAPGVDLAAGLRAGRGTAGRRLRGELAAHLPRRLADALLEARGIGGQTPVASLSDAEIAAVGQAAGRWSARPASTEGYAKAEVTAGGVDTRELDSRTMESRCVPGLFFIGEVVDVTGWLGGYNFQWAWSSAAACARALTKRPARPKGPL